MLADRGGKLVELHLVVAPATVARLRRLDRLRSTGRLATVIGWSARSASTARARGSSAPSGRPPTASILRVRVRATTLDSDAVGGPTDLDGRWRSRSATTISATGRQSRPRSEYVKTARLSGTAGRTGWPKRSPRSAICRKNAACSAQRDLTRTGQDAEHPRERMVLASLLQHEQHPLQRPHGLVLRASPARSPRPSARRPAGCRRGLAACRSARRRA